MLQEDSICWRCSFISSSDLAKRTTSSAYMRQQSLSEPSVMPVLPDLLSSSGASFMYRLKSLRLKIHPSHVPIFTCKSSVNPLLAFILAVMIEYLDVIMLMNLVLRFCFHSLNMRPLWYTCTVSKAFHRSMKHNKVFLTFQCVNYSL